MTQNDCMDSKREDVDLKEMRMAPDKPCLDEEAGVAVAQSTPPAQVPLSAPIALISIQNSLLQIKEGDGASEEPSGSEKGVSEDDDLTSLSWLLQDKNILKGINLRSAPPGVQESPTSDYVECDSASEPGDSTCSSLHSSSPVPPANAASNANSASKNKHPHHIPYDPKVHVTSKPPYSFSCLIFMAIEDSPVRALPVKEIYAWILDHFPYYKNAPTGWKNSVRHNLSLNKCFCKVEKAPNLGKGSLWMVDPVYRPNLVQALRKAPYHPYAMMNSDRSISGRPLQPDGLTEHQEGATASPSKSAAEPGRDCGRLPDPDIYPYLSRRLAATANGSTAAANGNCSGSSSSSGISHEEADDDDDDSLDDVDAAAAMLVLKHGPNARLSISQRKDEYHKQFTAVNLTSSKGKKKDFSKKEVKSEEVNEEQDMLITSCPSEDHTYSVEHTQALHTDMYTYRFNGKDIKVEPSSPDEAFQEGSDSNSSWALRAKANEKRGERDVEEERKIAEGADALLNLAGIATGPKRGRSASTAPAYSPTKRQRLDASDIKLENEDHVEEEEEEAPKKVPFRPRLLRKSPLKRDFSREDRKREKKACLKVLSYAQAIMNSMEKNNNSVVDSSTPASAKVRRKSLLAPTKHVAKVKR